jgi:transposase
MKITRAAKKLGLNVSTAKFLIKRYKRDQNITKKVKEASTPKQNQPNNKVQIWTSFNSFTTFTSVLE